MKEKSIYQIYYDEKTKNENDKGFIPIDNTKSQRPDLYEFWVILKYLREHELQDGAWYGFLSPKFHFKTGMNSASVFNYLNQVNADTDVCLVSPAWDQLAYFINPWEQGEVWHPGLLKNAQEFSDWCGIGVQLSQIVADSHSSVFSNYIIAKKRYWLAWKIMAEKFFEYLNSPSTSGEILGNTSHGARSRLYPMRTFIQERIPTLVLLMNEFKVAVPVQCSFAPIQPRIFAGAISQRDAFLACDFMKRRFNATSDFFYLDMYWKIRKSINCNLNMQ